MFDIGFSELVLIGIVALVVFGPEELPRIARTAGHMLGRLRRYVSDVKADISREMEAAELKNIVSEVQESARELRSSLNDQAASLKAEFASVSALPEEIRDSVQESMTPADETPDPAAAGAPESPAEALVPELAHSELAPALPEAVAPDHFAPVAEPELAQENTEEAKPEEGQLDLFGAPLTPVDNRKE